MTAVRATPLMSPGMFVSSCSASFCGVERCRDVGQGDVTSRDHLAAAVVNGVHERRRPAVLEDQDGGRRTRLDRFGGIGRVALVEQTRRYAFENSEVEVAVTVDVADVDDGDAAVVAAGHEHQVEDADDPAIHEFDEKRQAFTRHLAPGELRDHIADRPERYVVCHLATTFSCITIWESHSATSSGQFLLRLGGSRE